MGRFLGTGRQRLPCHCLLWYFCLISHKAGRHAYTYPKREITRYDYDLLCLVLCLVLIACISNFRCKTFQTNIVDTFENLNSLPSLKVSLKSLSILVSILGLIFLIAASVRYNSWPLILSFIFVSVFISSISLRLDRQVSYSLLLSASPELPLPLKPPPNPNRKGLPSSSSHLHLLQKPSKPSKPSKPPKRLQGSARLPSGRTAVQS